METILYFRPHLTSQAEKVAGVRAIAEKANIHVQIIDEEPTAQRVRSLVAFWKCRGAIVECGGRKKPVDPRTFGSLSVVFFNHDPISLPKRCFSVYHDSASTGTLAAQELLMSDAAHFAYISSPSDSFWSRERGRCFAAALSLNGKKCAMIDWTSSPGTVTKRAKTLQRFLESLPKPCAVFAANDAIAAEALTAARLSGIEIPNDITLLSVDNATDICEHTTPTLSSIEPDFRRGGELAMLMLLARIRDGKSYRGSHHRSFGDMGIIRRLSTKRLKRNDTVVTQALNLIRQEACSGLKASTVTELFPCSRRMADLRFAQSVGHSILDEIQSVRLERAQQLLLTTNLSLKALSDFCGFKNPNSLRKFFLKETGMTMSTWRKTKDS